MRLFVARLLAVLILLFAATAALAVSPSVVISQVYGGGGNAGAPFTNDFIELFNRGNSPQSLNGWSVQYASSTGTSWQVTNLTNVTLQPGQYYLIQEAAGATPSAALPAPNATGTIPMSATGGKVALVNSTVALTGSGCPFGANIVDFVGYGTSANCFEGAGRAPAPSNTTADIRNAGGCTETDNNNTDFATGPPTPRNTATPAAPCAPTLSINDVTQFEGGPGAQTFTFTISLTAPAPPGGVTFDVATADGTAQDDNPPAEDNDYVPIPTTPGSIVAGNTSTTVNVTINGDNTPEANETFFVNVTNVGGAVVGDGQGQGTINNDDSATLNINDISQLETESGTTIFQFTVSLTQPAPPEGVTFTVSTASGVPPGDATAGTDYVAIPPGTPGSIGPGNSSTTVNVTVNGDTDFEPTEIFFVNIANITGATPGDIQAQGTILTDDIGLSINDVTQNEGNSGTSVFTLTVSLTSPAEGTGVTFDIATADGAVNPANAGSDYVAKTENGRTIAAGASSATFTVNVNGDVAIEPNETFFVNVTGVTGAEVTDGQGLGTINNDDNPTFAISDAAITEGNAATQLLTFTVTLTPPAGGPTSVDYATADSSATTGDLDYVAVPTTTLNFNTGETSKTFDVVINGDTNSEGNEQFFVNLTNNTPGTVIGDNQALGIIRLDDPRGIPAVDTPVPENFDLLAQTGTAGTTPVGWTFLETGSSANSSYTADTGSSGTGNTYSYGGAGSPERAFGGVQSGANVQTLGAFYRNDTGTAITRLTLSYFGEEWRLGQEGQQDRLDFQYSLDATSLGTGTWTNVDTLDFFAPNTVGAGTKDGNNPANRAALSSTITGLNIAPGTTFWVRWLTTDDGGSDNGLAIDDFVLTANITGILTIDDVSITEGNAGPQILTFTITRSDPSPEADTTFTATTADNTATTADGDYVFKTQALTIPMGSTTTTFDVTINGDTAQETTENFFVNLTNVTNATLADSQGVGTILADDFTFTLISAVQGSGNQSPLAGSTVTVGGIVTGLKQGGSGGFFVQEEEAEYDADPNTSEGIFVFTAGAVPAGVAIGNRVAVTGTVAEFPASAIPHTVTELTSASTSLLALAQPMPAPITLTAADGAPSTNLSQYERFEGMRVAATLEVTAPTAGNKDETNATGSSNGVFYGVISGVGRAFREPGIPVNDVVPSEAACAACIPRFDRNPERIRVPSTSQPGAPQLNVVVGQTVSNLVGPLDYGFFEYSLLNGASEPIVTGSSNAIPAPTPLASELTVSSFNLERFYDAVDDPLVDDAILTPVAFNNRLNKASLAIRNVLQTPDVLGVVEVENLTVLQALATKINTDAAGATNYVAYLQEGNDQGGIDVGFLVNQNRVTVNSVTQLGKTDTFVDPSDNSVDILHDRPPLVLDATTNRTDATPYQFIVIVNHLRSLIGNEENSGTGLRVREKRRLQAEYVANYIQTRQTANPQERIITVGDFNAFQFNDGMVDLINTIKGTPPSSNEVVEPSADLVSPDLTNLVDLVTANERYSFAFGGNLQVLDHAIVSAPLLSTNTRTAFAHLDAGFPEIFRGDASRPERVSDHDAIVAYFDLLPAGALAFSAANYDVGEATTTFNVTVNRTGGTAGAVSATYTIAAGTATAGSDFTATTGTISFANGETSKTFPVTIANDTTDEPSQTIALSLSNPLGGATLGAQSTATITILDDDAPPVLTINDISVAEGNSGTSQPSLTVTLTGVTEFSVTVNFTVAAGTATCCGVDFSGASGTLTFAPGQTTKTVDAVIFGETIFEADETVLVNLSNATNATIGDSQGVFTITNDDAPPVLTINDLSVAEGNSGTSQPSLTVTLTGATSFPVTVDFTVAAGTATCCGVDFSGANGTLTFPVGTTTRTIDAVIFGDTSDEPHETILVNLSNATNATIGDTQGVFTIVDDDGTPALIINDVSVNEGNSGTSPATLTVTLVGTSASTITVDFATANGTATAGSDYTATSGTLTFPSGGPATQQINVTITGEAIFENNETVLVNLTNPTNATISDSQGVVTITNDDAPPVWTINDISSPEGNSGTSFATSFTFTLTGATELPASIDIATANGTATVGSDYVEQSGGITLSPGETTQSLNMGIHGDTITEPNETALMNLTNPVNSTIADPQGILTILNDDAAPTLAINDVSLVEGNAGTTNAILSVTLTGNTAQTVTVDFATANGTATAGSDYTTAGGTLTFAPGTTTQTLAVPILGETLNEPNETVLVNLTNATNATISDAQGVITITNDDGAPTLAINDMTVTEGNSGSANATFTVTLTGSTSQTVTVDFATANNTATAGSDYTANNGTLTFTAGTLTQQVTVAVLGDTALEPTETFFVNLTNATNATITDNQGLGTITDDDGFGIADLVLTQTMTPPNPRAGQFITLTLTLTNNGPADATNVVVTDNTPPGLTIASVSPSQGTCSGNPTVTCQLGTILAGANATITIVFNPPSAAGTFSNMVSAVSSQTDPTPVIGATAPIIVQPAAESDVKIPTLSEWALIALAMALAAFAAMRLRA